jgi:hypothetical protein
MREGIKNADFGLVVGTPFLKQRALVEDSNIAFELREMELKR